MADDVAELAAEGRKYLGYTDEVLVGMVERRAGTPAALAAQAALEVKHRAALSDAIMTLAEVATDNARNTSRLSKTMLALTIVMGLSVLLQGFNFLFMIVRLGVMR